MTQETKEWYDMAVIDLGVARHLEATYHPKPLEIICYHCQQSAEKLTPYGVSIRYPNELFLEEKHVKEALEVSGEILSWVKGIVEQPSINTKVENGKRM